MWYKNITVLKIKSPEGKTKQEQTKQELEVWSGAMEEWASSGERSHPSCAICLNRENQNIREQLCDLQGRNNMYEKPQLIVDLAENLYLLTKLVFRNQIYDYLQFNAMI